MYWALLFLLFVSALGKRPLTTNKHPICEQLVAPEGIPCETYVVETEDHYLNQLIHLPNAGKPAIYLQHGLLASSAVWMNTKTSLGTFLFRKGYDVWAGDSRGNYYSMRNRNIPPSEVAFWDGIDWDLMAKYDLPAFVDFVLSKTGKTQLVYIGHSQGTTQAFAAFSRNYGDLSSKISMWVAMAPVTYLKHQGSQVLTDLTNSHVELLFGDKAFPPLNMSAATVLHKVGAKCDTNDKLLCENLIYDIEGATPKNLNKSTIEDLLGFDSAGTGVRDIRHWIESVRYDRFAEFGYGWAGNLEHYGTLYPPTYDLGAITIPVVLAIGGKDNFTSPIDVARFESEFPANKIIKKFEFPTWEHNDFVWSETAPEQLYEPLLKIIENGPRV